MLARSSKNTEGYTLVEVLVALFVFVIVIGMVSASLIQVLNNSKTIKKQQVRLIDIQQLLSTMQFDFAQALEGLKSDNTIQGSFYLRDGILHFCKMGNVNPGFKLARSGLEEVKYQLQNNQIVRYSKNSDESEFVKQVLLGDVKTLTWEFMDNNAARYVVWPPTRDWAAKIPAVIAIKIDLSDYGNLELLVATSDHD